ncbi:MAG TPA: hypothetical protein VJL28_07160 [Gemmatimonadaceae bacterium]|nr:hypothetical protein [Gemmatimonadaceae bacterium]
MRNDNEQKEEAVDDVSAASGPPARPQASRADKTNILPLDADTIRPKNQ